MWRTFILIFGIMHLSASVLAETIVIEEKASAGTGASGAVTATAEATDATGGAASLPATYGELLVKGHNLYLEGKYEEAVAVYNEAKAANPTGQLAHYYIGCAQNRLKKQDEALTSFRTASAITEKGGAAIAAKALFMIAVVEESRGAGDAIKAAWKAYKDFASKNPTVTTFVSSADARIAAYEKKRELDEQYEAVRERISNSQ
jgi:tetratricopeptide (TPR) repeat protein